LVDELGGGTWPLAAQRRPLGMDSRGLAGWLPYPAVDVTETDDAFEIIAELPGMDEKSVDVTLANGVLTIQGEKTSEREESKKEYYLSERSFGSFKRCFLLPEGVDTAKIEAIFKNGALNITLPKTAEAKQGQKKIIVKHG